MRLQRLFLLAALPLAWSCARDEDERRALFEQAERVNTAIFEGAVVRDLRAPTDTGRLVYDTAVSLRLQQALPAGAAQVWAPFGIAQPDTVAAARRTR